MGCQKEVPMNQKSGAGGLSSSAGGASGDGGGRGSRKLSHGCTSCGKDCGFESLRLASAIAKAPRIHPHLLCSRTPENQNGF